MPGLIIFILWRVAFAAIERMKCPTCGNKMTQLFTSYVCEQCEENKNKPSQPKDGGRRPHILYGVKKPGYEQTCLINGYILCGYTKYGGSFAISVIDKAKQRHSGGTPYLFEWFFANKDVRDAVQCEWLLFKLGDEVWIPLVGTKGQNRGPLIINMVNAPPSSLPLGAVFKENVPAPLGGINQLRIGMDTVKSIHQFWCDILSGKQLPTP